MIRKSIARRAWIFACAVFCVTSAGAETLEDKIQEARKSGSWGDLIKTVQARADGGDPLYQTALGSMYLYGLAGQPDLSRVFDSIKAAAEKGFPLAQNYLGALYGTGLGVRKDSRLAFEWYRKAAMQGVSEAQYNLGYMYGSGEIGEVNEKQSLEWYEKAAAQNFALAWLNLGAIYLKGGVTVQKDEAKAFQLMQRAADAGVSPAQLNLGMLYLDQKSKGFNPVLAYYYLRLAGSEDTRGRCLPPALWVAARKEREEKYFSDVLIVRDEMMRQPCMRGNPQAKAMADKLEELARTNAAVLGMVQGMKVSADRFLERRKLLDAPPGEQIEAARQNPYQGEMGFFMPLSSWKIVTLNKRDGDKVISEIQPGGSVGDKIKEHAAYEQTFNLKYEHPHKHLESLLGALHKKCAGLLENKMFDGNENGYPAYVMNTFCQSNNDGHPEMHFLKVVQGDHSLYFWHGEWEGTVGMEIGKDQSTLGPITDFSTWLRQQFVCDTSLTEGAHACPPGTPRI